MSEILKRIADLPPEKRQLLEQLLKKANLNVSCVQPIPTQNEQAEEAKCLIEIYLKSHQIRKLQLRARSNSLKGWLNTDYGRPHSCVFLDITKPFPIADSSFDYIFGEHMIEHISYHEGLFLFRECYRILREGGKIRIATPNLKTFINLYRPQNDLQQRFIRWTTDTWLPEIKTYSPCFVINNVFRAWGHQFIYDYATLRNSMESAGFTDIISCVLGESSDDNLCELEGKKDKAYNLEMFRFETMILEGKKSPNF